MNEQPATGWKTEEYRDARGVLLALVFRQRAPGDDSQPSGATFLTPPGLALQVGVLRHAAGHVIRPHAHRDAPRTVPGMTEVLLVQRGRLEVTLYADADGGHAWEQQSTILGPGDAAVLVDGGHGFTVLEECEVWEVKQGTYRGDDKVYLDGGKVGGSEP